MDLRAHADAWLAAWKARDLDAIMACYRRENGNRVLDVVELDEHGRAARVRAFYEQDQV
jgi:hypothetical protein